MNNEPVAWMLVDKNWNDFCRYSSYPTESAIPLYTHPAKTLTDEKITEVIKKIASNNEYVYSLYEDFEGIEFSKIGIFEFAKAILRKAGEK